MAEEEERRNLVKRAVSGIRSSSSGGAGEPSSEKHRCCICKNEFRTQKALCGHMRTHPRSWKGVKPPLAEQQSRDVRDSAAAEQSIIPVQESVPVNEPANISIVAAGAGVAVDAIIAAHNNGTVLSDVKKKVSSSSSSAAGGGGAHTCEKCGRTFATGQSLGGHMRKHYDGPPIIANKKRTREQQPEETPAAPTADRKVRMASHFDALPSQSQEEPERLPAGNGARRLHNLIALLEKGPKNAPQPEPARKDDDALLSLRLGQYDFLRSSSGV